MALGLAVIEHDNIGLLTLVKALGEYLTSTEDPVRARGELISAVSRTG